MARELSLIYDHERILEAVEGLAKDLHRDPGRGNDAVTFLVLLKGGARFAFDLMSCFPAEYRYDFAHVSSYADNTFSQGMVEFRYFALKPELINGRLVVLLDDICDTGVTFAAVTERIRREFEPLAIRSCSLIRRAGSSFTPDHFAFEAAGDDFFVGYGLGIGEEYRHLNGIYSVTVG